jgi:hypothetical protein
VAALEVDEREQTKAGRVQHSHTPSAEQNETLPASADPWPLGTFNGAVWKLLRWANHVAGKAHRDGGSRSRLTGTRTKVKASGNPSSEP